MERVKVRRINGSGVAEEDVVRGDKLIVSSRDRQAVIRVYVADTLTAVYTFCGVDQMLWEPK